MKALIITEKPTAYRNFEQALGGATGTYCNMDYELAQLRGHLMTLSSPEEQVDDKSFAEQTANWNNTNTIPWPLDEFNWNKTYLKQQYSSPSTHKSSMTPKQQISHIKKQAARCDTLIIATDSDDSGEGDVLGQEIVDAIAWTGKVLRLRFADESSQSLIAALNELEDISNPDNNPFYERGKAREQFDYASMQLSRLASQAVKKQGYDHVIRPGRLKSVIIELIYQQTRARDLFQAKEQFRAVFIDNHHNKFIDKHLRKHDIPKIANEDLKELKTSTVTVKEPERIYTMAPKMMNLDQVSVAVDKTHASIDEFLETYQKMYEAGYLSYPRTADNAMTLSQWEQLAPLTDKIANLIHVAPDSLTNRDARAPYVTDKALSHGCNRPGLTIPTNRQSLEKKYGKLGWTIYETIARSYLAVLSDDYECDSYQAFITDYPTFVASKTVPVSLGFKRVLQVNDAETTIENLAESSHVLAFGTVATPQLSSSKTSTPTKPSRKFVTNYLRAHKIGTGATRLATISDLLKGKTKVMSEGPELGYSLNRVGTLSGAVLENTLLASPKVTNALYKMIEAIGNKEMELNKIYEAIDVIIDQDRITMENNATKLSEDDYLKGRLPLKNVTTPVDKYTGIYNGTEISINRKFMKHEFSQQELEQLYAGENVTIMVTKKNGQKKQVRGKLAQKTAKFGNREPVKYWGFDIVEWL